MTNLTIVGKPNEYAGEALADVLAWALAEGLIVAAGCRAAEPVDPAEVVEIVGCYEGYAEPTPFVLAVEPVFVERRKKVS